MKKIETRYYCDICGKETSMEGLMRERFPFITECNWEDGKPEERHIVFENIDICRECLMKTTNLYCGFRAQDKRFLTENHPDERL